MRKRKLVTQDTIKLIMVDLERGVPLARAIRNTGLEMSRPAVAKLITYHKTEDPGILASLYPDWLQQDGQEQPDGCTYEGYFPLGRWA